MDLRKLPQPEFSIQAFQTGHEPAFKYVYDLYYAGLCFFANRVVQNLHQAEDIVQDTYVKLWEMRTSFESLKRIKAFLYISTRNACFNLLKRLQVSMKNHKKWSYTWTEEDDEQIQSLITQADLGNEVFSMIEMLPKGCRKIMRHTLVDGWSNQEIAERLKISIHTVKNQKARAIYLIRKRLANKPLLLLAMLLLEMKSNPLAPMPGSLTEAEAAAVIHMLNVETNAVAN